MRPSSIVGGVGCLAVLSAAAAGAQETPLPADSIAVAADSIAAPQIFYELDGGGPAIVLVPDWAHDTSTWFRLLPRLRRDFELLRYDLRGQGRSGSAADQNYGLAEHADDLRRVLDGLGIERPHLVGVGFGGRIAVAFAQRHPSRARSVILVNPRLAASGEELGFWNRFLDAYDRIGAPSLGEYTNLLIDRWLGTTFVAQNPWIADFFDLMLRRQNPAPLIASIRWWLSVDLALEPGVSVTVPVLLVRSREGDLLGEPQLRQTFPRLRHVRVDAAGRYPHVTAARELADEIGGFVREIEREER